MKKKEKIETNDISASEFSGYVNIPQLEDPAVIRLNKINEIMKEEELFGYFIQNLRAINKDAQSIIEAWVVFKKTITPVNIDFALAEERMKFIVVTNRKAINYDPNQTAQALRKIEDKLNEKV